MRKYGANGLSWLHVKQCFSIVAGLMLICCSAGWASESLSERKHVPKFTRQGDVIVASLIPKAKSTHVRITFGVSGASLVGVTARPFEEAAQPDVDEKDFKSGLFVIQLADMPLGSHAEISVTSDFFSSSTEFWTFNEHRATFWEKAPIKNKAHQHLVQELILTVTDGGPLDADNTADGRITLVGGPWDSFWGYALGTLFIRFFGIFLVLSVLMAGMVWSGKIFEKLQAPKAQTDRKDRQPGVQPEPSTGSAPAGAGDAQSPPEESVAAIAMGLHMHFSKMPVQGCLQLQTPETAAWVQLGRQRAMGACSLARKNVNQKENDLMEM